MTAPIQLYGPYRTRGSRLRRSLARFAMRQWLGAWLELAVLALFVAAVVVGVPFLAGVLGVRLAAL